MVAPFNSLPDPLYALCYNTLLRCNECTNFERSKSLFDVAALEHYRQGLQQGSGPDDQVKEMIHHFLSKGYDETQGLPVFAIFLRTLFTVFHTQPDSLHDDLINCYEQVEIAYALQENIFSATSNSQRALYEQDQPYIRSIIDHFRNCTTIQHIIDRQTCARLLEVLPSSLSEDIQKIKWYQGDSPFVQVLRIITVCSKHEHGNGVDLLACALFQLEGGSDAWLALDASLRDFNKKDVTYTRILQLLQILKAGNITFSPQELMKAYHANPEAPELAPGAHTLHELLDRLAESYPDWPILAFVWQLAHFLKERQKTDTAREIEQWCRHRARELGVSEASQQEIERASEQYTPPQAAYLVIEADTLEESTSPFELRAWLLDEQNTLLEGGTVEAYKSTYATLMDDVSTYINKIGDQFADSLSDDLIVEFFLHDAMLYEAFDRIPLDVGRLKAPAGIEYMLTVRSLSRARSPRMRSKLKSKWKTLKDFHEENGLEGAMSAIKKLIWICTEDACNEESFYAYLRNSHIVSVGLEFIPQPSQKFILDAVLSAGIPVALIPRRLPQPEAFKKFLSSEFVPLFPADVFKIPKLIKEKRVEAQKHEDHYGRHITLLWDDAERLPEALFGKPFVYHS